MLKLQFQFGIAILGRSHARLKLRLLIREMFDLGDYKLRDEDRYVFMFGCSFSRFHSIHDIWHSFMHFS